MPNETPCLACPSTHPVRVRKSLRSQKDLLDRREHCSANPRALSAVCITKGQQVRVKRNNAIYALYTVSDDRTENADNVVRMGPTGRWRLGTGVEFDAEFDSQVVHPTMSDKDAEMNGEFIERLHDDGQHTGLIVIAPHGGDIEKHTDNQAERVASGLADKAVSHWLCKGYHPRGAEKTWHITSADIQPGSFPLLNSVFSRRFAHAIAFHGFERDEILVGGGTAAAALKKEIESAIKKAVVGSNIPVRIADPDDPFGGDDRNNIVNRITIGGANGIQIEQSLAARIRHWDAIADAVGSVLRSRMA
jgi:phage replication-related protein YjqB (UPF0714/DUF867 family)